MNASKDDLNRRMDFVSDVLLMLASFSIRMQFVAKAVVYGRVGVALFPHDLRLLEIYAYALLLDGQSEEAASLLADDAQKTRNLIYLRLRVSLLQIEFVDQKQNLVRLYLQAEHSL